MATLDLVSFAGEQLANGAPAIRLNRMLHFHGFQNHQGLALFHLISLCHQYINNGTVHSGLDLAAAGAQGTLGGLQLRRVSQQLDAARAELTETRQQLATVTEERNSLQNAENNLSNRAEDLQTELQRIKNIAADSINLERRNRELREENQKLRNDLEVLTAENERLEASKESDFMLLGAGLVFGGVLLALIIPMLKPTRKTDNWA